MKATDPRFEAWLCRETGIDATALGVNALERAVLERVHATQKDGNADGQPRTFHSSLAETAPGDSAPIDAYWQLLSVSADERQALVEELVVPETWFFRDREAFVALARLANERLVREPARALRVLSAPCSTGEEAYSIAMALLDAGIGPDRFTVDALDISARAIELAAQAMYGRNSFRGQGLEFRERHFSATERGWLLDERVRHAVRLTQANLFELAPAAEGRYDFIFCRNVLIYFNREAQDRAIRLLDAQLADDGTIFVGPAETGLMMRHAMTSARIPLAFAFQHARPEDVARRVAPFVPTRPANGGQWAKEPWPIAAPRPVRASLPGVSPAVACTAAPVSAPRPRPAHKQHAATPHGQAKPPVSLDDVRSLADAGQFSEAERLAHEFVIVHGPHADAFCLLGLIADARGLRADANDFYRKALYLDPIHYEALTHRAALLEMDGDTAGAQQLMRRAQRAAAQPPKLPTEHVNHLRGSHDIRRR
jgi:chemotaxis protein methyltransferase WspC